MSPVCEVMLQKANALHRQGDTEAAEPLYRAVLADKPAHAEANHSLGDREQYRFVLFRSNGEFVRTIQMRNLTCSLRFDPEGEPWLADGMDGQVLKIDRDGNVLGAIGGGQGKAKGQFLESNYMTWDKNGNIFLGDTILPRITELIAPKKPKR